MDCTEVKGEGPAEEQLEPLLILEEGDELEEITNNTARGKAVLRVKEAAEDGDGDGNKGSVEETAHSKAKVEEEEEEKPGGQQIVVSKNESGEIEQVPGMNENSKDSEVKTVQAGAGLATVETAAGEEMERPLLETAIVAKDQLQVAPDVQSSAKLRPKDRLRPEDAHQKVMSHKTNKSQ